MNETHAPDCDMDEDCTCGTQEMLMTDVYYCGCIDEAGHYVHLSENKTARGSSPREFPKIWQAGKWDICTPRYTRLESGWSLVCVRDNTVDTRPGSHSTVIARGDFAETELWKLLKLRFPNVHARLVAGGVLSE